ncbi:hypothetical protein ABKV19_019524 [Rosa sericea]
MGLISNSFSSFRSRMTEIRYIWGQVLDSDQTISSRARSRMTEINLGASFEFGSDDLLTGKIEDDRDKLLAISSGGKFWIGFGSDDDLTGGIEDDRDKFNFP